MPCRHDGLRLWQHNSTVCLGPFLSLESVMLWPICAFSSCICGSRGAGSVSFDDVSFGDFSAVGRHVRDVVLCEGV